jgi:lipopolysaccharide export system protein LptA
MRIRLAVLLLALSAVPVAAQQRPVTAARVCVVVLDSAGIAYGQQANSPSPVWFGSRGVGTHCRDEATRMRSDSVEWYGERGELYLIGNVHYRDSAATLDADRVTYWVRQERLYAVGNVYTRNLVSGSELRGPNLDYYRAKPPIRDTLAIVATGRPTIRFRRAPARGAPPDTSEPFIIVADRTRMKGQQRMWGSGHVTIDRSDLKARADSAMVDLGDSVGFLIGAPQVIGRDTGRRDSTSYRLTGQRIRFDLTGTEEIKRVKSSGDADALGPDWRLTADTIDLALDSNRIQRARAWGRQSRSNAHSDLSTITADSLDIHMPDQVMQLVWAFGRARATSKPDSAAREDDWLSGDSLRADFAERTDSLGRRRSEIRHVLAFGTARAYYHVDNQRDRNGPPGVNYSRGQRIAIAMRERKVNTVDIVGQVDGIYLEPAPPDSAARDSLRSDSLRTDSLRTDSLRTDPLRTPADTTQPRRRAAPARPGRPPR